MQVLNPLAVRDVTLSSRHTLQIVSVYEKHLEALRFQNLKDWNPKDTGRFHRHCVNPALLQPISQGIHFACKRAEGTYCLIIVVTWNRDYLGPAALNRAFRAGGVDAAWLAANVLVFRSGD